MASIHTPHRGSLGVLPRKRAKKQRPRLRTLPNSDEVKPLCFSGYKAGMTHAIALDETDNSPTKGMEVFVPLTIVEVPPMRIVGIRVYRLDYDGLRTHTDVWVSDGGGKKPYHSSLLEEVKKKPDDFEDIRLITQTNPQLCATPKKKPDVMEMPLGGSLTEKIEYAIENLGSEIKVADVFSENQYVDVTSVTKGKGFQGVVKRYGVRRQPRKSSKGRRHLGTGGSWKPARKLWTEPLPGQMGYHTRTEYNKLIMSLGGEGADVTPRGGFLRYGPINSDYLLLHGSIPGPTKRVIRLSPAKRNKKQESYQIKHLDLESKQGGRR
ncbi:MAG: 50S ribosomal protein L3 [Candidatus Altiarchaeales archaeon]|nr:50S ribosomal protein L3 [Candidatus Altiarchaeales archaeon]